MSTIDPRELPPSGFDDDALAAEFVLGVQDADERRALARRIDTDAGFRARVEAWEAHFAPWADRYPAMTPSPALWSRIVARLGWLEPAPRVGLLQRVGFWQAATALAAAAGLAAIVFGLRPREVPQPAPPPIVVAPPAPVAPSNLPVAVLARDDGSTAWIASIDARGGTLRMAPVPSPADTAGRVHELWLIPAGKAPVSLGLLSNDLEQTVEVPARLRDALTIGATLAVTLESSTGIPHPAPSGPIVAKGGIDRL